MASVDLTEAQPDSLRVVELADTETVFLEHHGVERRTTSSTSLDE